MSSVNPERVFDTLEERDGLAVVGRALGKKKKQTAPAVSNLRQEERMASRVSVRDDIGRFLPGNPGSNGARSHTAREWKLYIEEHGMKAAVDALITAARGQTISREQLDAAREVKNTVIGKPTEKVQVDSTPVTVIQPSQEQLTQLAERILGGGESKGQAGEGPEIWADAIASGLARGGEPKGPTNEKPVGGIFPSDSPVN